MSSKPKHSDHKIEQLRRRNCVNREPERITDPQFAESDFFDPHDLVQVKYEMLRRVQVDGQPISTSAAAFGFSRPSFYLAQAAFEEGGLPALLPKKPGPRRSHKLNDEVMDFIDRMLAQTPALRAPELSKAVLDHFGRKVHPRSIERALARRKKKRR